MPIVWEHPDGRIELTRLTPEWLERERKPEETTAEAAIRLAEVIRAKVDRLALAIPHLVKEADVPKDRTNRNNWRLDKAAKKVKINA